MKGKGLPHNHKRRMIWIFIGILILAVFGYGTYAVQASQDVQAAPTQAAKPAYQTAAVRQGNLSSSISGTGKLVSANTVNLNFSENNGKIAQINVKVGDMVKTGQVLATLQGVEQLQQAVKNAQFAAQTAQKSLKDLQTNAELNLAQAFENQANAQASLASAQANLHRPSDPRCAPSLTQDYYFKYLTAKNNAAPWENALGNPNTGYGKDYIIQQLRPIKHQEDLAYYNWQWCQSYTTQEIQASQANLQTAQANVQQAEAAYQTLQTNQGIDPNALQLAQTTLKNAENQVIKAQNALAAASLVSPIDGVVTTLNGAAGQKVDPKTTLITLSDIAHPLIQTSIDETDLEDFAVGCPAQVTFSSMPDQPFTGIVTQVLPTLTTAQNVTSAQGLVELKQTAPAAEPLLLGLNASVTITCQRATNALQVPVIALHEPEGQPAYVYIMNQQGQPEKHVVEIGVRSSAFAEIRSGLKAGDQVITSGPNLP